jgi:hypothetical protein
MRVPFRTGDARVGRPPREHSGRAKAFAQRIKMNSLARAGKWSPELERAA